MFTPFQSGILICSSTGEQHTIWTCVHQFSLVDLICLNKAEQPTSWIHIQPFILVALICSNTRVTHFLDVCSAILISGTDLPKYLRTTHILDVIYLISKTHGHLLLSYQFSLQKIAIRCHWFLPWMSHTYCQYSISLVFVVIQYDCTHILNHMLISGGRS